MANTFKQLAGRHLMIGVSAELDLDAAVRLFQDTHAAGLIVFRRNFESAAAFKAWLVSLENALERRLIVAVDHEGGRVIHLREGVTYFPDNLVLGWTGSEEYARRQGAIEAGELRRLGIDLNLAPTVDVLTASYSPNIGIRSYGKDAALTARLGAARIQGMQKGGLSACAKHFPGQGQSPLDAHLDLPVLPTTLQEYQRIHALPFKAAVEAGVHTVMTSHPVYPNLPPSLFLPRRTGEDRWGNDAHKTPATFSKAIVTGLLREELGFKGVILSDDLEMGALKNYGSVGECAVKAVEAGHDMVLVCADPEAAREAARKLSEAIEKKSIPAAFLEASGERIRVLRAKRDERFSGSEGVSSEGDILALKIAREGLRQNQLSRGFLPALISSRASKRIVLYPRISALGERIAMEPAMENDSDFIASLLKSSGVAAQVLTLALDPDDKERQTALEAARNAEDVLYFCFDPHLFPGSRILLNALEETGIPLNVVFLRDPFGADLLVRETPYSYAFGFRAVQIKAVLELLTEVKAKSLR